MVAFAAFVVLALGAALAYVLNAAPPEEPAPTPIAAAVDDAGVAITLERVRSEPHLYLRSTRAAEHGRVVVAARDAPDTFRFVTDLTCDRIDFGVERGICLVDNRPHLHPRAYARILNRELETIATVDLPGVPSRTRLSRDERYAAATLFVEGDTYAAGFSTRTVLIDVAAGESIGDLEQFDAVRDGQPFRRVDFNYWGVTFTSDSSRFYATLSTGGTTYLVEGDIGERRVRVLRENVECPSLSPDETHIAFKSRLAGSDEWRIHILSLATMEETAVELETRSIDDQVEWLDDDHVLYGFVADRGSPEDAMGIWMSPVRRAPAAPPILFARAASSPAVIASASAAR